ncbi:MAG: ABC transporter permease [Victivallales bacterium]|nr:ABC transporter permease [Victivallales bacterium]
MNIFTPSRLVQDIQLGIKNLLLHKLRSFLTMLGLVFGVGSVIAMLAVGEGASEKALDQIRKLGSRNIIVTAMKPISEQGASNVRTMISIYGLLYSDVDNIAATIPTVKRMVPVKSMQKSGRLGQRELDLRIVGTNSDWFDLVSRPLVAGRTIVADDVDDKCNVVVLTEHGARNLLATEACVGEYLRLGSNYYEVIGIVKSEGATEGGSQTPDQQTDAYIPISVAKEHYGDYFSQMKSGTNIRELVELHQIIIEVDDERHVEATARAIERNLGISHKKKDYQVSVPLTLLRQAEETKRTFNVVLGAIAGISLLVGGIGIMNIMLASVTERTREIGIRRAIGAKQRQIVAQFLIETVVLSFSGGLIGIGLGIIIPWMIEKLAKMPTIVNLSSLVLSLGISVSVGIIFGIYPAFRAARLDPIVALRHE